MDASHQFSYFVINRVCQLLLNLAELAIFIIRYKDFDFVFDYLSTISMNFPLTQIPSRLEQIIHIESLQIRTYFLINRNA
jgi:hypothetical protein